MKHKILVIDDELTIRKLLESYLLSEGYEVICKSDGKEALDWLQEDLPNLIICDIQMQNLNGYAFLKIIREEERFTRHTPIVMLSGVESSKERIKCYTDGAQDFLAKPFHPKELLALIKKNLEPIHYETIKEGDSADQNKQTVLIIDDEPITRKLLENLVKNHKRDEKIVYETITKSDGMDALFWLERNIPDLIICDVEMAPMNGYDFLKNLRQRGFSKHIPVVMLSGVESPTERIECYDNGAQDFMAKPFNPEELWKLIEKNLKPVHFAKTW